MEYEEGSPMTADSLMNLAANKYKIRLRRNKWNAKSESETKILHLEEKLMSLQKKDKSKVMVEICNPQEVPQGNKEAKERQIQEG